MIGIPYQVIIGKRDLKDNLIEIKDRKSYQSQQLNPEQALNFLIKEINLLSKNQTLKANIGLIINNALLAGKLAKNYKSN